MYIPAVMANFKWRCLLWAFVLSALLSYQVHGQLTCRTVIVFAPASNQTCCSLVPCNNATLGQNCTQFPEPPALNVRPPSAFKDLCLPNTTTESSTELTTTGPVTTTGQVTSIAELTTNAQVTTISLNTTVQPTANQLTTVSERTSNNLTTNEITTTHEPTTGTKSITAVLTSEPTTAAERTATDTEPMTATAQSTTRDNPSPLVRHTTTGFTTVPTTIRRLTTTKPATTAQPTTIRANPSTPVEQTTTKVTTSEARPTTTLARLTTTRARPTSTPVRPTSVPVQSGLTTQATDPPRTSREPEPTSIATESPRSSQPTKPFVKPTSNRTNIAVVILPTVVGSSFVLVVFVSVASTILALSLRRQFPRLWRLCFPERIRERNMRRVSLSSLRERNWTSGGFNVEGDYYTR